MSRSGSSSASRRRPARLQAVPAAPPSAWLRARVVLAERWEELLAHPVPWVVLFLAVGTWCVLPRGTLFAPQLEVGTVATRDVTAPRDLLIPDDDSTHEKQQRARDAVLPVYDLDPGMLGERQAQLARLFAAGRAAFAPRSEPAPATPGAPAKTPAAEAPQPPAEPPSQGDLERASGMRLAPPQVEMLVRDRFSRRFETLIHDLFAAALRQGIVASKSLLLENRLHGVRVRNLLNGQEQTWVDVFRPLGYPEEVRELLRDELRTRSELTRAQRELLLELVLANVAPNLTPNRGETVARRDEAAREAGTVFRRIRQGQVIVRQGDPVDAAAARAVAQIGGGRPPGARVSSAGGVVLLLGLVALALWWGARREQGVSRPRMAAATSATPGSRGRTSPRRTFVEMLILLLLALLGTRFGLTVADALAHAFEGAPFDDPAAYRLAIPYAALATLGVLLWGRHLAVLASLAFALLAAGLAPPGEELALALYAAGSSVAAIAVLDRRPLKTRGELLRAGAVVAGVDVLLRLVQVAAAGSFERGLQGLGYELLCAAAGGLAVAAVTSVAVPICESLLGITTSIQLVELANTNLPMLRRLALEAPGTFQHSLMVANLAKAGCEAIEADAVLAYTGGLYHDIGKVYRPEYFVENQRGTNPHDKLLPSMSALVLVQHVKDGLGLARLHRLPAPVRDAIEQHHGTRLMRFFHRRAVELAGPDAAPIEEAGYRYPGPAPTSKTMGVLMLADSVEAAARSLADPSTTRLRQVIRTIVDECLEDGQLDATDLTLGELHEVEEAFLRVLGHLFHRRIEYPGYAFNAGAGTAKPTQVETA